MYALSSKSGSEPFRFALFLGDLRWNDPIRKIKIRDSIRQGVLAVVEYANLMDEIAKELGKDKENIITIGNKNMPGCLLWMDDIVLIHHDKHIMQNMIDTTNEIANRYRIQFGQEKSKIMIVGKDKDDDNFKLGQMPLQKQININTLE